MKTSDLLAAIQDGECDGDLDTIMKACGDRSRMLDQRKAADMVESINVGDNVRIKLSGIRPKYLRGKMGTVTQIDPQTLTIHTDISVGRYNGVYGPATIFEVI